jgi:hypothetical protein
MSPLIKNIIIVAGVAIVLFVGYFFFLKPSPEIAPLVSSSNTLSPLNQTGDINAPLANEFLTLLLSVKSIRLDDSIFSNGIFNTLRDSSIILTPDATIGRPNPFAPLGNDFVPIIPATPPITGDNLKTDTGTIPPKTTTGVKNLTN